MPSPLPHPLPTNTGSRKNSPDGSRRQMFETMIESGKHSFAEINKMKHYLQFEGWQESDKIPVGWRIKIIQGKSSRTYFHLIEQGERRFRSVKFVQTYRKYYKEGDAEMLIIFLPTMIILNLPILLLLGEYNTTKN